MQEHEYITSAASAHRSAAAKRRQGYVSLALLALLCLLFLGNSLIIVPGAAAATQERSKPGTTIFTYQHQPDGVYALDWSPDSKRLAIGGEGVQIINPANGKLLFTYREQPTAVNAVAWSPDGKYLASADAPESPAHSTVKVWLAQ